MDTERVRLDLAYTYDADSLSESTHVSTPRIKEPQIFIVISSRPPSNFYRRFEVKVPHAIFPELTVAENRLELKRRRKSPIC